MTANKTIGEGMGTKRRCVVAMGALAIGIVPVAPTSRAG